jgi:hypothetical protein
VDFDGTQSQAASVQADAERLVPVALLHQPHEAHLARLRLEAEGLRCVLEGEHMSGLAWPPDSGVRVLVPAWQRETARRVLAECEAPARARGSADWVTGDLDATRCPSCGSLRVREARVAASGRGPRWRVLGVPLPFLRRRAACRHCGHRWVPA